METPPFYFMHTLIHRLLQKRGIDDTNSLSAEEKQTFDNWQAVLTKDELTTDDIKNFCKSQVEVIEAKWADLNTEQSKKAEMIPYHTVYKLLLSAINSPVVAREALEKNLSQLIS